MELSPELAALTERLAENAHDLWAAQRLRDGWTWGAQRDDKAKKHPCLVPYADLPDSEKEYDRQAAMGTLKAILALGYRIEKPRGIPMLSHPPIVPRATSRSPKSASSSFSQHLSRRTGNERISTTQSAPATCHPGLRQFDV